jgi:site-specific recombinase XerC
MLSFRKPQEWAECGEDLNKIAIENPNVRKIRLYDLRHFYGTMLYHKTKDILYNKTITGHERIETTLLYAQLIEFGSDKWTSAVARTVEDACKLI